MCQECEKEEREELFKNAPQDFKDQFNAGVRNFYNWLYPTYFDWLLSKY